MWVRLNAWLGRAGRLWLDSFASFGQAGGLRLPCTVRWNPHPVLIVTFGGRREATGKTLGASAR